VSGTTIETNSTPLSAIFCVFGAFFAFSCTDAGAKYLVLQGMHPAFASWVRFVVHMIVVGALLRIPTRPSRLRVLSLPMHILRGMLLLVSGILGFSSLLTLQLVEMVSIAFAAPLVITALAGPLLGERIGWQRWIAILVGFGGVLVITRPGFGGLQTGHLFAGLSVLSYCFFAIMTRWMSAMETQESLLLIPAIVAVLTMLPVIPSIGSLPENAIQWCVLLALGVSGSLGHWLLLKAYRVAAASAIAPYAYLQMLWTLCFGYFVFGQMPDGWTVAGSSIIVAGGLYLVHSDRRQRLAVRALPNINP